MNKADIFLKNYLQEISIGVERVRFTHCSVNWKSFDYVPAFSSIGFIRSGEGWMKVGSTDLYPKEGQLYLLPAGTLQSFSTINENTYHKYFCHFHAKAGSVSIFDILKLPLCINVKDTAKITSVFEELLGSSEKDDIISIMKAKSKLLELILFYIENCSLDQIHLLNTEINQHIRKAVNYIEANLKEDISVEKIAEITGYHPCYFIKLFKETFGIAPIGYINKRRLEKSMLYLLTTNMTIAKISEETGFNSQFYFSNLFRKHTGMSPTEYRNVYQSKP